MLFLRPVFPPLFLIPLSVTLTRSPTLQTPFFPPKDINCLFVRLDLPLSLLDPRDRHLKKADEIPLLAATSDKGRDEVR